MEAKLEKVCKVCLESKELSEFHKSKNSLYGVVAKCKACLSAEYKIKHPPKNVDVEGEKTCLTCGDSKEYSEFHKQPNGKYGIKSKCKACCSAYNKSIVRTPEFKEHHRKRAAKWRKDNPQKHKESYNKSRNKHKDKINAKRKEKYATDEEFREKVKEWERRYKDSGRRLEMNSKPEQREKARLRSKRYLEENRELLNKKSLEYKKNNYEKCQEMYRKQSEELVDSKIIALIRKGRDIDKEDITQEMIETRRLTIKLKRELKT